MPSGSLSLTLQASPEAAFAVVSDLLRAPEWVPDLVSVTKVSDGPVGVGTRFTEVVQMGDKRGDGELWVTVFGARFTIEPEGDGCRITHDYEVKLSGMARLMAPLMGKWVEKNSAHAMQDLKQLIERQG